MNTKMYEVLPLMEQNFLWKGNLHDNPRDTSVVAVIELNPSGHGEQTVGNIPQISYEE